MSSVSRQLPMPFQRGLLRDYYAAGAARELAAREKHYPAMVEAGEISREEADADLAAWRVITALLRDGSTATELSWAELELATQRAFQQRSAAVDASPGDADLLARRDAVWGIHERISWWRSTIDRVNDGLQRRSAAKAA